MQRESLCEVLRTRLTGAALTSALARAEKENDLAVLSRWFKLSLTLAPEALLAEIDK